MCYNLQKKVICIFIQNDYFTVTDVVLCHRKTAPTGYILSRRARKSNGLTLILSGELVFNFKDTTIIAKRGDIILQQLGDAYQLQNLGAPAEYVVISYLCEPQKFVSELTSEGKCFQCTHLNSYAEAFNKAVEVSQTGGLYSKPLLNAITQQLICRIIRENEVPNYSTTQAPVAAAKRYIDEHAYSPITIEQVANHVGFSVSHLRNLFKQAYGIPPIKYLNSVRIQHAKELLSSDFFTLEEISSACGFSNVYYFSRVFKEYTGISPGQY